MAGVYIYNDDFGTRLFIMRNQSRRDRRHDWRLERVIEVTNKIGFRWLERGRVTMGVGYFSVSDHITHYAGDIFQRCFVKLARELYSYNFLEGKPGCDDQHSTLAGTVIDEGELRIIEY